MPAYFTNPDGSIRPFTSDEIAAIGIESYGIRQGEHPTHSREVDASTIETQYLINGDPFGSDANFERFVAYMLGASTTYIDTGTGRMQISRLMPQTWPGKPQFAAVKIPRAIGHKFLNDDVTSETYPIPTYDKRKVTVIYQHMPFALIDDTHTTAEYLRYTQTMPAQHEVSYLNLPGGVMRFFKNGGGGPSDKPIPYSVGFPVPMSTITRKWIRVPFEAWGDQSTAALYGRVYGNYETGEKPYTGTVNNATFLNYPPGYMLYLGVEEELQLDPLGDSLCWNLSHKWLISHLAPHTWKYYFSVVAADAGNNGWYFTAKDGSGFFTTATLPDDTALFNARDHSDLFDLF